MSLSKGLTLTFISSVTDFSSSAFSWSCHLSKTSETTQEHLALSYKTKNFVLFWSVQRVHDKKDVYNLNEEEELTHYGQSLAEMEKFNDLVNSDDESEEKGLLSGEYRLCSNTEWTES